MAASSHIMYQVISSSSSAPVKMCRVILLMTLVTVNIHVSSQAPPRISACRPIHKAKEPYEDYTFSQYTNDTTCGAVIEFPLAESITVNVTDLRNCENFFKCEGLECLQCPCPAEQTFNPVTLQCDNTRSQCACPSPSTNSPTTAPSSKPLPTTKKSVLVIQDASNTDKQGGDNSSPKPVSTEVIIIAGIVSATVIVIVIIVMGVFCWQRKHAQEQSRLAKPAPSKLSCSTHDGYSLPTGPVDGDTQERHVYAEIDERVVNGSRHWQHGGSMRGAPPLPNHQPPMSPAFKPCPHHHHMRSDSGLGSADTSFTNNYPKRTFQPINPAHNIRVGVPYNAGQVNSNCCGDELYHARGDSSASSDSQYSATSTQTSVDSHDIDLTTPLHHHNYMSKQVYI